MKNKFKPNDRVRVRKNIKLDTADPHMSFTMELLKRFRDNNEVLVVKEVHDSSIKGGIIGFCDASDMKRIAKGQENICIWQAFSFYFTKYKVDQNTYPDFEVKDVNSM